MIWSGSYTGNYAIKDITRSADTIGICKLEIKVYMDVEFPEVDKCIVIIWKNISNLREPYALK